MPKELGEQGLSQVESQQLDVTPGAEGPQAIPSVADIQPGAEPVTQERTYSHKEWAEREEQRKKGEVAKDKEIAQLRQAFASQALHFEITQAEAQDRKAVEDGEITSEEATKRQQTRRQGIAQQAVSQRVIAETEQYARVLAAKDFGEKYGVDPKELLNDPQITNPDQMEIKALKLAREKEKMGQAIPERYDSGQVGVTGASLEKMSPEEKIKWALEHPSKKR